MYIHLLSFLLRYQFIGLSFMNINCDHQFGLERSLDIECSYRMRLLLIERFFSLLTNRQRLRLRPKYIINLLNQRTAPKTSSHQAPHKADHRAFP